jgi:thioredoxin 1
MKNYNELTVSAPVVLVEFFAAWCPHCQRMMPIIDTVKHDLAERVPVYQFDVDQNPELTATNDIESYPTFIIYANGKEMWRYSGETTAHNLLSQVHRFL